MRQADGTEVQRLRRMPNVASTIVGAWAFQSADDMRAQVFAFLPDGRYMMIDPLGDDATPSCGGPGIEFGTYTWEGATGTLRITGVSIDTNGCAGLNEPLSTTVLFGPGDHSTSGIELAPDGSTMIITTEEDAFVFVRSS